MLHVCHTKCRSCYQVIRYTLKLCSFEAKVTSFEIDKLQILKLQACGLVHVNHVAPCFHTLKFEKGVGLILQQILGLCTTTISCLLYMRLTNHVSCLTLPKLLHFLVDYLSHKLWTTCHKYIYIHNIQVEWFWNYLGVIDFRYNILISK
jgi:hypothetical protein